MELMQAVMQRRSVRKYQDKAIAEEVLSRVLEAARQAPSWANVQPVRWIKVTSAELKSRLAETLSPGNPSTKAMTQAPVVLGLCYVKGLSGFYQGRPTTSLGEWGMFDAGLAAANLTLAAAAEGLGTVHVGAIDVDAAAKVLQVPEDAQLVELMPIGYPATEGKSPPRKELADLVFTDKYRD